MPVKKIVSGGQWGVDRAALEVAKELGLKTGGYCPHECKTTLGVCPELKTTFGLQELDTASPAKFPVQSLLKCMYIQRSKANVDLGDVTIAFRLYPSPGTDNTIGYAATRQWKKLNHRLRIVQVYKPYCVIETLDDIEQQVQKIRAFLDKHQPKIVNIAGHRETTREETELTRKVKEILRLVFKV